MSPTFDQVHAEIAKLVGLTSVAFGVRFDWLNSNFAELVTTVGNIDFHPEPTSLPRIHIWMTIASITTRADVPNKQMLLSGKVDLLFITPDDTRAYRNRTLSFENVPLQLVPDPLALGEFRFEPKSVTGVKIEDAASKPDADAIKKFYDGDTDTYIEEETAVLLVGGPTILQKFAYMIPFPRLRKVMRTFVLDENVKVDYTSEYLVVSGPPVLQDRTCPFGEIGNQRVESDSSATAMYTEEELAKRDTERKKARLADCQEGLEGLPNVLFYYPQDITLGAWKRSVIGPAIGAQDSGSWLLFEWHYAAAAILDAIDIQFDVQRAAITAVSNWHITGSFGAGVQIACVVEDVVDVDVDGTFGPLKVDLAPCIDPAAQVVYFKVTIASEGPPDLNFSVQRPFPFPISAVADLILDMIFNRVVSPNLSSVVDIFRIKLVEMKGLPSGILPRRVGRSVRADSLAIGLGLAKP